MLVQQLLKTAAAALAAAGVQEGQLEAERLLRHCLGASRSSLFLMMNQPLPPEQAERFQALLRRRCLREPLQYVLGCCEFWSLEFHVGPAVLIPRPETEFLLEHALAVLRKDGCQPRQVVDLCTGSGVIAVVLAKELPQAVVTALDCSMDALAMARSNVVRHGMAERISLLCADLLTGIRPEPLLDLVVSNPPYVKAGDLAGLAPEVRDWEPHLALSGGSTGMDAIRKTCCQAASRLLPGGWLFMEIGADLEQEAMQALQQTNAYEQVMVTPDWSGRPRVAQGRRRYGRTE